MPESPYMPLGRVPWRYAIGSESGPTEGGIGSGVLPPNIVLSGVDIWVNNTSDVASTYRVYLTVPGPLKLGILMGAFSVDPDSDDYVAQWRGAVVLGGSTGIDWEVGDSAAVGSSVILSGYVIEDLQGLTIV